MRPSILFIVTKQHRAHCVGYENHPVLLTPNLDNIAHNGVRFGRFYSTCPSCISARRSMLTGQLPQTHGLVGYCEGLEWDAPTLPGVLRDHGYQTHLVGRTMHQFPTRFRRGYESMEIASLGDYLEFLRDHGPSGQSGCFGGGVPSSLRFSLPLRVFASAWFRPLPLPPRRSRRRGIPPPRQAQRADLSLAPGSARGNAPARTASWRGASRDRATPMARHSRRHGR